jgi:hypothetical protein
MDRRELLGVLGATAAGLAAPPASAATAGSQYYGPIHPSVMSTFPANCPYCQMALKRK